LQQLPLATFAVRLYSMHSAACDIVWCVLFHRLVDPPF